MSLEVGFLLFLAAFSLVKIISIVKVSKVISDQAKKELELKNQEKNPENQKNNEQTE